MAKISCPECGKSVSSEAPGCPSCGYPIKPPPAPAKKTGLWWGLGCLLAVPAVLIVVAIVGILAAIAIPSFMKARETSQMNACVNNMRMIESAKDQAVLKYHHVEGDIVPEPEVSEFLRNGFSGLICPKGGRYTINPFGQYPECSVHGNITAPVRRRKLTNRGASSARGNPRH